MTAPDSGFKPVVSFVMAAHNEEAYIRGAIESIIAQAFVNWELIIVDDGSTDGTKGICCAYEKYDRRINVVSNELNLGLPRSLNIGIEMASGDFIARTDADDVNLPNRLEVQLAFLMEHEDIDVLGSSAYLLDKTGRRRFISSLPTEHEAIVQSFFRKTIFFHPSVVIRRHFFDRVGLYDPTYIRCEDKELWIRGIFAGCRYANVNEPLIEYRTNGYVRSFRSIISQTLPGFRIARKYKIKNGFLWEIVSLIKSLAIKLRMYTPKSLR